MLARAAALIFFLWIVGMKCQGLLSETGFVSFEQSSYIFPEGKFGEVCLRIHVNNSVLDAVNTRNLRLQYYVYTAVGSCQNSSCNDQEYVLFCYCSQDYLDHDYYTCYDIVESCPNLDSGGRSPLPSSIVSNSAPISREEFSLQHHLLTFPEGASQGDRECVTITFFQDNVTDEGLKCFTLGVYGYYYYDNYNYHNEYHAVPVCKTDGGFVKFVDTFYNITEPGMVEVGVELIGNITFQTTFLIEVVFATATVNVDYLGVPFNLTFTKEKTMFVTIFIIDDQLAEDHEVIELTLTPQTPESDIFVDNEIVEIRIIDDDSAEFTFSQPSYNVSEDDGVVSVCLELTESILSEDITIRLINNEDTEATATNEKDFMNTGNITFTSGTKPDSDGSQMCLDIFIVDDDLIEGIEKIVLCGSYQHNKAKIFFKGGACRDVFIEDNDVAIFRFTQEQYDVDETNGEACVCLELISGILALDIIIEVAKQEDYDIAMESGSALSSTDVNSYVFFFGTKPIDVDAQKCRKISIDNVILPTKLCGYHSQNSVLILNDGCTEISIGDDNEEASACTTITFIPLSDLTTFVVFKELDQSKQDSFSDPIYVPGGLLFGNEVVTAVYVNENGVISFNEPWQYSYPNRFPTRNFFTRTRLAVAPFWSDNDIRRAGAVRYATYHSDDSTSNKAGQALLARVNNYIQKRYTEDRFIGNWLLVAHWDHVHPSPHGEDNVGDISDNELKKTNNYQGIVVTDGLVTFVIFTYICGEMEWSSLGNNHPAIVGYSAGREYFYNYALSGFSSVGDSVSCIVVGGTREKRQDVTQTTNLDLQLPVSTTLTMSVERCKDAVTTDEFLFIGTSVDSLASDLEPCPCTLNQAINDVGRFLKHTDDPLCYLSIPKKVNLLLQPIRLTQQCCYDPNNGYLQTAIEEGSFGTMLLYHPVLDEVGHTRTDSDFRDACCGFNDDLSCGKFIQQRPINDCTEYQPPTIATGSGDPHYTTFDGRYYTINGFGEFILVEALLEGGTVPEFTLQGRLGMVSFWRVTTHLALSFGTETSSFHFGMAPGFRVFKTRPGPAQEITDQILNSGDVWYDPDEEAALYRKGNELKAVFFQSGIAVIAQANPYRGEYYINFRIQVPRSYSRRIRGMLGNFDGDSTNDFYRRDSTPLPNSISERALLEEFKTWQVSQEESLFYYAGQSRKRQAGGTYDDFQNLNFVPIFSDELNFTDEQRVICEDNPQCLFDLAITEETTFAMETLEQEKVANTTTKTLENFPPNISAETIFRVNIGRESVYSLTVVDPGDNVTLSVQGEPPQDSILKTLDDGEYVFSWSLSETTTLPLVFIATDSSGASSTFIPVVEICACANEGNCTRDGLLTMNSTVVLNCICNEAFSGTFCEEDHNGCSEIQCFEGVECMDVPAPGVGAVCGPCPFGYTGDSFKCYDIDECAQNATLCGQLCVNTDGSYFCSCEDGYELVEGTNQCRDIDECAGINPCQQLCINTEGSFFCNCTEGFTLAPDERNCTADDPCQSSICSHICGVINGMEKCFCPIGFELSTPGGTQCTDQNECLNNPCDQQCSNTHGSFECSCMDGYELQTNEITCKDIDECLVAALINVDLCENDTNTQCINTDGSHECVCVPGFERVNGTCEVIENETPPPTQVLIPNIGKENSINFTARALTLETFTPSKLQSFRDITSSLLSHFCSNTTCILILMNQESQEVSNLTVLPSNIAIPTSQISENENGQLQIVFYVQIENDFLFGDQLQVAVQQGLEEYRTAGFLPGANISLPEFVNVTEGEEVEICVTIIDDEQPLQRDILLSFSVIPNSMLSSAVDMTLVNTSIAIPPGVSEACLQLAAVDDEIVEGDETFTLTVEATDPSDTVNGNVPITISDNDGATLSVNRSINIMEGEIQEICISADCNFQSCEREVPITLLLLFNCTTCDTGDFNATDLPLEIPIGPAQACFQFEAVDDEIVESDQIVSLIIDTLNPYDIVVDENSTIIISDNDGVEITFYDNATVIISEGEMFDVCLNISELSEERERDVVVYIIFISPITSSYSTADGDLTAENVSITITPGMSEACFEILAVDDEIVENDEEFVVTAEADNPNDIVTGNVSINILDNDGAILKVKGSINLTEREVREICVEIEQTLERTVPLSFSFILDSVTSGDFNVINQPAEIPIGASEACFQLEAVDDDIIEAEEEFTLVTETIHPNDTADGSTRVVITDNDYVDIDFNGTRVVTEGSVLDICVPFSDQRERDVVISFTFTPISLTSADSDVTIVNKSTLIPPGVSEACIQLLAVNDEIVEDDEAFILTIESELPQDRVNGSVSVIISDNDGVSIAVNEPVNMTEGDVQEVCVTIESTEQSRERLIPISLTFIPKTSTTNRGDVNITNSVIEIPIGESEACIHLGAVDDNIVENEEEFILAVRAININDVLDRNTTLFISDNDGVELKINQSITIIEGGIQEICVATHDPELALERDIPFLIIAHGNNTFGDGDDFQLMNANDSTVDVISRGQDKTCFELMANDDDIIEDEELFTIVVEIIHPNDRGTNTTVTISDNDGAHMSLVYPILDVTESEQFNICVKLVNNSDRLQRTVPITLDFGDADDIRATTGYYEFKPDAKPLYCFNLTAIDDDYIESIEYHEVLLKTVKQLDSIDVKETIVTIFDNDNLPSEVDVNTVTVLVTLKDLNTITFDADKQQLFKETTAQSINEYCDTNENCQLINFMANRRKRQADVSVRVTADDIILRDIRNSNQNGVEFSMFVMTSDGSSVLSASTLINTIEASADAFNQNGFSTPSTSLLYTQSTSNLSGGIIAAIVIAVVVVIATVIITATIIIILYRKHTRLRKKSVLPNVYIEQTSMSIMNVGAKLDGEADKDNIQEHEMCDVDDEKKKEQED